MIGEKAAPTMLIVCTLLLEAFISVGALQITVEPSSGSLYKCGNSQQPPPPAPDAPGRTAISCRAKFPKYKCAKGECPTPDLGVWCCCGEGNSAGVHLPDQHSSCHVFFNETECNALRVTCKGCDNEGFCACRATHWRA